MCHLNSLNSTQRFYVFKVFYKSFSSLALRHFLSLCYHNFHFLFRGYLSIVLIISVSSLCHIFVFYISFLSDSFSFLSSFISAFHFEVFFRTPRLIVASRSSPLLILDIPRRQSDHVPRTVVVFYSVVAVHLCCSPVFFSRSFRVCLGDLDDPLPRGRDRV